MFIDLHCDTAAGAVFAAHKEGGTAVDYLYNKPDAHLDVRRLRQAGGRAQFFACFTPPLEHISSAGFTTDRAFTDTVLGAVKDTAAAHPDDLRIVGTFAEYRQAVEDGVTSAFLTLEEGRPIDGKMENLDDYYDQGVRLITLTWNFKNCFGSPNSKDPVIMQEGLTDFGKEAVVYMQEKGMIVDVSHLSDGGFYDVAALCKKPFIASHSDARTLCRHTRNLTDEMLKILADHGGITGLNFCPEFIDEKGVCTYDGVIRHAHYIANTAGVDVLALGSDFDGIGGDLEIDDVMKMPILLEKLHKSGFTYDEVEKIAWKNAERILQDTLR
ncbi:MAG: dipeptidase [Clostridiales bacterium]|nr:dipeptidase [Clostridiales bacterium]